MGFPVLTIAISMFFAPESTTSSKACRKDTSSRTKNITNHEYIPHRSGRAGTTGVVVIVIIIPFHNSSSCSIIVGGYRAGYYSICDERMPFVG